MDGFSYVHYSESIVIPRVWMEEVPVGPLHTVIRNAIYTYILNDFGRANIYVEVLGITTRLHRRDDEFWFERHTPFSHECSKNLKFCILKIN